MKVKLILPIRYGRLITIVSRKKCVTDCQCRHETKKPPVTPRWLFIESSGRASEAQKSSSPRLRALTLLTCCRYTFDVHQHVRKIA